MLKRLGRGRERGGREDEVRGALSMAKPRSSLPLSL